ncbi:MAG: radical SAM protein, partial [Candidatus Lokiarchaeota archaeon]
MIVDKVRVSLGSAAVLDLIPQKFKIQPSTCYLMTYIPGKCSGNCGFCPQSRSSTSTSDKLSRVTWPEFSFERFLSKLKHLKPAKKFKRICIQTLNYPNNFSDLRYIVQKISEQLNINISIAIPPMSIENLKELKSKGVNRIGIALDAATPEIFRKVKGDLVKSNYTWKEHFKGLKDALKVFPENVSTHIIVGLGETEKEVVELLLKLRALKILPSLFAFTPIKGTSLGEKERPSAEGYRKIQLSRYLIFENDKNIDDFTFNSNGKLESININENYLKTIIDENIAFMTTGCPNCDRPFYTSRPSGPFYNFPRKLHENEK